jgi:molecular chaperone DnaK
MVKDAEANAEADRKRRDIVEARNRADAAIYETEKSLREHGDKVSPETRRDIETAIEDLKRAREGEDPGAITRGTEALMTAAAKLGEQVYRSAGAAGGEPGAAGGDGAEAPKRDGGTVDAEYEVVDEDKDKH